MDTERYQKTVEEMEAVVCSNHGGSPDKEAKAKLEQLADTVLWIAGSDPYIADKARSVKRLADILYSVRKHRNYNAGAAGIRSQIRSHIHALASWPDTRANMERINKET